MTAEERMEAALHCAEPVPALRGLVQDLAREGSSKTEIYGLLEKALAQVRARPVFRESDEDAVLDVMDALTGWCHTSAELLPERPATP
jgi:hypothetical protein